MATYIMLGKYSPESIKGISAKRTEEAREFIKQAGGEMKAVYAVLGDVDIIAIAELPDTQTAMKASVGLTKLTGVFFHTMPAVPAEDFDKLMA